MRLQSTHPQDARGLDPYWTPVEAVYSLLAIEAGRIPRLVWEPAVGTGAIADVLLKQNFVLLASDIHDYGYPCHVENYLHAQRFTEAIITNPPFQRAELFILKALKDCRYSAFLLRTNFLESMGRKELFDTTPPSRVWISSRRLPMMHRLDWTGPKAPSNTCYAWFIWDAKSRDRRKLGWFDWREHDKEPR